MDKARIREALGLSSDQARALDIEGDTLLVAGAGAGKSTTLLGALAADLLLRGTDPSEIALVTFTRASAASLRARLEETLFLLGAEDVSIDEMWIGTIDSIAARVLRKYSLRLGADPHKEPASKHEQLRAARRALEEVEIPEALHGWVDVDSDEMLGRLIELQERGGAWMAVPDEPRPEPALAEMEALLEGASPTQTEALQKDIAKIVRGQLPEDGKWNMRSPRRDRAVAARDLFRQQWLDYHAWVVGEAFLELWREWQKHYSALSFGQIMNLAEESAPEPPLSKLYLDEAQDTSREQFRFLRSLLRGPLVAVGDPNQSIYSFRGADLENFLQQTESFQRIVLRDNYRSGGVVLDEIEKACRPLLGESLVRMRAAREGGEVFSYFLEGSRQKEAEALCAVLRNELSGHKPEDIAVLFRANEDLQFFYRRARQEGLPVAILSSGGLALQEECQDMMALLRVIIDPEDQPSRLRVLSSLLCGMSAEEMLDWSGRIDEVPLPHVDSLRKKLGRAPLSLLAEEAAWLFRFDLALLRDDPSGARWENVLAFFRVLRSTEEEGAGMNYGALLEELREALEEDRSERLPPGAVRMQTIHQSKGDEFPVVVLPRLGRKPASSTRKSFFVAEDGQLGISLPGAGRDSVAAREEKRTLRTLEAEEKRLLYVAMTRASDKLLLLGASRNGTLSGLLPALPNEQELPEPPPLPQREKKRAGDPKEEVSWDFPRPQIRELSWSALRAWKRCSLRRQLEGEWGLTGAESEGGSGGRLRGLAVHKALALGDSEGLDQEEKEMYDRAKEHLGGTEYKSEEPFVFSLGPWLFRGRVDALIESENLIIDWKTGEEEDFREDYAAQRRIYALALLLRGAERARAQTVYLRTGRSEEETWQASQLGELRQIVLDEVKEILEARPEPASQKGEPFCAGCPGQKVVCPVSREQKIREEDLQTRSDPASPAERARAAE